MTDLLIRNVPDEMVARLEGQAATKNQSRQGYLLAILLEAASSDYIPTRWGEGYRGRRQMPPHSWRWPRDGRRKEIKQRGSRCVRKGKAVGFPQKWEPMG